MLFEVTVLSPPLLQLGCFSLLARKITGSIDVDASSFSPSVDFCNFHTNTGFENTDKFTLMMIKSIAHNSEY